MRRPAFCRAARVPTWLLGLHHGREQHLCSLVLSTPQGWLPYSLVMFSSHIKAPQENVSVAQVAVGPPLSCLVSKLLGNSQALQIDPNLKVIT